ncbi:D-alanyl-D-alanine carboxypeptidase family protein [Convivina praedatoris]|uniref:D-alanyl-D-alanine carboxypeptidase DacA n=1 Tax=Convivina praedatoris TaxID=2880963 RepID=A0ABM9D351_9LACO|nr:serine hydrolase [Convivina sp. LMG 32447]CAH1853372.1 D-alanyl-D-alanine carboxypeptidase DacA [Convivina sp. LMG 32447]CAH1854742.1 D-alanyl-D-alanine carboxypeptidase DacA [Convivina sp. LMG 32447]CAH1855067.1 D-alanyl-D-alanine carboxypeptidase DacA [Convivina sp. LMG 32447]
MNKESNQGPTQKTRLQLFDRHTQSSDRSRGKIIVLGLALLGLFCVGLGLLFYQQRPVKPTQRVATAQPITLHTKAKYAIVIDAKTGQILGQKDANQLVGIASQTKMLTAYGVLRAVERGQIKWSDKVPINQHTDWSNKDSDTYAHLDIHAGQAIAVRALYGAMFTSSANDAALALAEYVKPKDKSQQAELQQWADELHLTGSKWYNAAGQVNRDAFDFEVKNAQPNAENKATVTQLATLAWQDLKMDPSLREYYQKLGLVYHPTPDVNKIAQTEYSKFKQQVLPNLHNADNFKFEGLKTGSTPDSGGAFTGLLKDRAGHELITVVSGAGRYTDQIERYQYTVDVANEVLEHTVPCTFTAGQTIAGAGTVVNSAVKTGKTAVVVQETKTYWVPKEAQSSNLGVYPPNKINQAPVKNGQRIVKLTPALKTEYIPNSQKTDRGLAMISTQNEATAAWWQRCFNWLFVYS